ncbi:glycosyltransferase family 1 protein [Mucilaginibacter sp. ZT4R22]|uniref:Glycosyltransferase family 1 protein n=1 Tax=Mucilaginibacter pankratovii TaxID=2772110 RepID=A0ABR7WNR8_9SPHI|nr:glycosyltransferase [Mucilaginibacter pankratovii]MBD1363965.1 glycosyltransferase family 1 protein [Mucilaginibacter pankratovii]
MRILLSFLQDKTDQPHPVPGYRFWEFYIKNGINEAGMQYLEVPDADWAEGLIYTEGSAELQRWKDKTWQATINYIQNNPGKIDLFLCYLYPKQIEEHAIRQIQKLGIPCVNFYCDNVREFKTIPPQFKIFDLVWVPEYEALPTYKAAKIKHINLPMPIWVAPNFRDALLAKELPGATFIGSKDVLREQLLSEVMQKGLNVRIGGSGWLNTGNTNASAIPAKASLQQTLLNQYRFVQQHGLKGWAIRHTNRLQKAPVTVIPGDHLFESPAFEEYISITQNSTVTLGINRVPTYKKPNSHPLTYSRLRDIEAPMLGACYLTEYTDGLPHLYDLDKEIWSYKNANELVEKANELLKNKEKRTLLRRNGQQRALNDHSIPRSLTLIRKIIFG